MRTIDADALLEQMQPDSKFEINSYADAAAMTIANAYIKLVENQPTVQPETNCSEIPNNSDTISRQQAIDALRKMQTYKLFAGDDLLLIDQAGAQTELMMLPSAQPEYPKGRWIPTTNGRGRHECSRCHEYAPCYQDGSEHLSTFCVLCGAKMERGEEE